MQPRPLAGFVALGALAGAVSTVVFTVVHQWLISPIWFALPAMLAAGVVCGMSLAWSYALVAPNPTVGSWLLYNLLYLAMFIALGITSLAAFDPVTTIAALLQTNEPPRELISRALPMTGVFTLGTAALLCALHRPTWRGAAAILTTTVVLVLLLGLNISVLGLVEVPREAMGVLAETFVLLLVIIGIYAAMVEALGRGFLASRSTRP
jgi:hypothetical protein